MKKNLFLSVIIIIFTVVFYHGTIDAQVTPPLPTIGNGIPFTPLVSKRAQSSIFGGKIQDTKAREVLRYEQAGYECEVPGTTIEIRPKISTGTSYFIPFGTYSRTKYEININQHILGRISGDQNIHCKRCEDDGKECYEVNFSLPIITMFGNSRN